MNERIPLPAWLRDQTFRVVDAREHGVGEGRLRNPALRRPFRGVRTSEPIAEALSPAKRESEILRRCLDFAPLLKPGHYFSHTSAAALWDVPLPPRLLDDTLHVTAIRPTLAPRMVGITGHHVEHPKHPISERLLLPVSGPLETWISLAPLLGVEDLTAAGDHLVLEPVYADGVNHRPYTSIDELVAAAGEFHGRGARRAVDASALVRQGAESRPETLLRLLFSRAHLPEPVVNGDVRDIDHRFIGRADLAWPEFRVIVEYDGDQHRTSKRQYEKDATRIDGFIEADWRVVRVRSDGLFVRPLETVSRVTRALRSGGWKSAREIAVIDPRTGLQGR